MRPAARELGGKPGEQALGQTLADFAVGIAQPVHRPSRARLRSAHREVAGLEQQGESADVADLEGGKQGFGGQGVFQGERLHAAFDQRVDQQALAEAARAGEEVVLALLDHAGDEGRLVYVVAAPLADLAQGLDAERQSAARAGRRGGWVVGSLVGRHGGWARPRNDVTRGTGERPAMAAAAESRKQP